MQLHKMKAPKGASSKRKRLGRGESSGLGKTSGHGNKGQTARTGKGKPRPGFEGGQTPMYRRMPKRGFVNIFAKKWCVINVSKLEEFFEAGAVVDLAVLRSKGLAKQIHEGVRVLGGGDLTKSLTLVADHCSASAREKITSAGGTVKDLAN